MQDKSSQEALEELNKVVAKFDAMVAQVKDHTQVFVFECEEIGKKLQQKNLDLTLRNH